MDVLNMKYRSQVNEFYKNLNKFLFFKTTYLKFGDLLGGWKVATNAKFQHNNISKITPAGQKKHKDIGCDRIPL